MRQLVAAFAVGFLLLSTAPPVEAQGTFPLEYKIVKGFRYDDNLVSMSTQYISRSPGMPAEIKGRPAEAKGELTYYAVGFGTLPLVVAIDAASPPNLFVDRNGDGSLTDEKPVKRTRSSENETETLYGPVSVAVGKDGASTRILLLQQEGQEYLRICPAGYLTGQVKAGFQAYRIAVIDSNFDGRYSVADPTLGMGRQSGDMLGIDINGNGRFEYDSERGGEIQPLTPMVRLGEGYYKVNLTGDGSGVELVRAEPKTGTLAIKGSNVELLVLGASGMQYLKGPKASWDLPEGRYVCQSIDIVQTDEQKARWLLRATGRTGPLQGFEIQAGRTRTVELGAPLTVKADVQQQSSGWIFKGTEVAIGFVIAGKGGEEYSPAAQKDGVRVPAPKITIYDQEGKVLASGNFAYG